MNPQKQKFYCTVILETTPDCHDVNEEIMKKWVEDCFESSEKMAKVKVNVRDIIEVNPRRSMV